jgi:hypothetical protein
MAVDTDGRRKIVGLGLGPSEAEPFWSAFLKSLVKCGLKGVKLVISDAHLRLPAAGHAKSSFAGRKRVSPVFNSSPSAAPQGRRARFRLGRARRASADRAAQVPSEKIAHAAHP